MDMLEKTSGRGLRAKTSRSGKPKAEPPRRRDSAITGFVDRLADGAIEGWAIDRLDLARHLRVRALADGAEIGSAVCDLYREDVHKSGAGDGRYGFRITYDGSIARERISVVIEAADPPVRLPFSPRALTGARAAKPAAYIGYVERVTAGELTGWALDRSDLARRVRLRATVNGQMLGGVECDLFREDLLKSGAGDGRYGFSVPFDRPIPAGEIVVVVDDAAEPYRLPLTPDAAASLASLQNASRDLPRPPPPPAGEPEPPDAMAALQAQVADLQAELARFKGALGQSIEKLALASAEAAALAPLSQELRGLPPLPPEHVSWHARGIYRQLLRRLEAGA